MKTNHVYLIAGVVTMATVGATIYFITKGNKLLPKLDLSKFDSSDGKASGTCMNKDFLKMLTALQKKTSYPIFDWVNSGVRSEEHNRKVGGVSNSSHKYPTCRAADIHAPNQVIRDKMVEAAKEVGFKRIGIGSTFVHLDNDPNKSQYVAWGYPVGSPPPYNPFA